MTSREASEGVDAPTLKEQGVDLDIANWRSVMARPRHHADAAQTRCVKTIENMVKSPAWAEVLKQKGWDDAYLAGDEFAAVPEAGADAGRRSPEDRSAW